MGSLTISNIRDVTWSWVMSRSADQCRQRISHRGGATCTESPLDDFPASSSKTRKLLISPSTYTHVPSTISAVQNYRRALGCSEWVHSFQMTSSGVLILHTYSAVLPNIDSYKRSLANSEFHRDSVIAVRCQQMRSSVVSPFYRVTIHVQLSECPRHDLSPRVVTALINMIHSPELHSEQVRTEAAQVLIMGMPIQRFALNDPQWSISRAVKWLSNIDANVVRWMMMRELAFMERASAQEDFIFKFLQLDMDLFHRILRTAYSVTSHLNSAEPRVNVLAASL